MQQGLVAAQLKRQLPGSITYEPSQPVAATEEEVDLILGQGGLPAPYQLAVLLMFDLGLRVSEATGLRWEDVDLASGTITIVGKGNKLRQLPIVSPRLCRPGSSSRSQRQVYPAGFRSLLVGCYPALHG